MKELTDRVEALAKASAEQRRGIFDALKTADPAQAGWLQSLAAEFGKPDAIRIRVDGKEFRKGRTIRAQDYPDWQKRLAVTLAKIKSEEAGNGERAKQGDVDRQRRT